MKLRTGTSYYLENGNPKKIEEFPFSYFLPRQSIYEVIRFEGRPFFFDEHLNRMKTSVLLAFPGSSFSCTLKEKDLLALARLNHIQTGNIRLEFFPGKKLCLAFFIPHHYPDVQLYRQGVPVTLQYDERILPNAKVYNPAVRQKANSLINQKQVFETLLVNSHGYITEGSRSNVFFIKNNGILTPPEEQVLPGITRAKIMEMIRKEGITLTTRKIKPEELSAMDAAFLTGTSIKAIPIKQIDNQQFDVNTPLLQKIVKAAADLR